MASDGSANCLVVVVVVAKSGLGLSPCRCQIRCGTWYAAGTKVIESEKYSRSFFKIPFSLCLSFPLIGL